MHLMHELTLPVSAESMAFKMLGMLNYSECAHTPKLATTSLVDVAIDVACVFVYHVYTYVATDAYAYWIWIHAYGRGAMEIMITRVPRVAATGAGA